MTQPFGSGFCQSDAPRDAVAFEQIETERRHRRLLTEAHDKTDRAMLLTILKGSYEFDAAFKKTDANCHIHRVRWHDQQQNGQSESSFLLGLARSRRELTVPRREQ